MDSMPFLSVSCGFVLSAQISRIDKQSLHTDIRRCPTVEHMQGSLQCGLAGARSRSQYLLA